MKSSWAIARFRRGTAVRIAAPVLSRGALPRFWELAFFTKPGVPVVTAIRSMSSFSQTDTSTTSSSVQVKQTFQHGKIFAAVFRPSKAETAHALNVIWIPIWTLRLQTPLLQNAAEDVSALREIHFAAIPWTRRAAIFAIRSVLLARLIQIPALAIAFQVAPNVQIFTAQV